MADHSLVLLCDEVRSRTLSLLHGVDDAAARWAPPGLHNSLLWHGGHCYILAEWLALAALGYEPRAPLGWFELFSWNSRPQRVPHDAWPPLGDVYRELSAQHARLRAALAGASEEELSRVPAQRTAAGRPARYYVVHALHDEACHSGEMWLLRKMRARDSG
jgi:hypothetical protein